MEVENFPNRECPTSRRLAVDMDGGINRKIPRYVRTVPCPNIIGSVSTDGEYGSDIFKTSSIYGAFVSGDTVMGWSTTATQKGVTTNTSWLMLNASKSNGIYSKSNTVQSAAIQILIIIKV